MTSLNCNRSSLHTPLFSHSFIQLLTLLEMIICCFWLIYGMKFVKCQHETLISCIMILSLRLCSWLVCASPSIRLANVANILHFTILPQQQQQLLFVGNKVGVSSLSPSCLDNGKICLWKGDGYLPKITLLCLVNIVHIV